MNVGLGVWVVFFGVVLGRDFGMGVFLFCSFVNVFEYKKRGGKCYLFIYNDWVE